MHSLSIVKHGSTKNIGFIRNSANLSAERLKRTAKIGNDHQKIGALLTY